MTSFVETKVHEWSRWVDSITVEQPQTAYIALTKSLQYGFSCKGLHLIVMAFLEKLSRHYLLISSPLFWSRL